MTKDEFELVRAELQTSADSIVRAKQPDYTQDSEDVLANFKNAAKAAGISPLQAWLVHFEKQYSAVCRIVKNPSGSPSEPILSRFSDLRNYLDLGLALFKEKNS